MTVDHPHDLDFDRLLAERCTKCNGPIWCMAFGRLIRKYNIGCSTCGVDHPCHDHPEQIDFYSMDQIRVGDLVRGKATGDAYVITSVQYEDGGVKSATAVRSIEVTWPNEWILMRYKG